MIVLEICLSISCLHVTVLYAAGYLHFSSWGKVSHHDLTHLIFELIIRIRILLFCYTKSGNDDNLQKNAPPRTPLVPADPAPEVVGGGDVDMEGGGGGDVGVVVGGGVGGGPAAPVVNPLLLQQQHVPQQIAPLPLQMPPQQNLLLHRAQQQRHRQLVL